MYNCLKYLNSILDQKKIIGIDSSADYDLIIKLKF
jgi:hypothetical protein